MSQLPVPLQLLFRRRAFFLLYPPLSRGSSKCQALSNSCRPVILRFHTLCHGSRWRRGDVSCSCRVVWCVCLWWGCVGGVFQFQFRKISIRVSWPIMKWSGKANIIPICAKCLEWNVSSVYEMETLVSMFCCHSFLFRRVWDGICICVSLFALGLKLNLKLC